jgi:hypothetical protein
LLSILKKIYHDSKQYMKKKQNKAYMFQHNYFEEEDEKQHQMPIFYVMRYHSGIKLDSHLVLSIN